MDFSGNFSTDFLGHFGENLSHRGGVFD